jgi:hypothetical protein
MTKISEQILLLKRIIASKKKYRAENVETFKITAEKSAYEIQCLEDSVKALSQIAATIGPML